MKKETQSTRNRNLVVISRDGKLANEEWWVSEWGIGIVRDVAQGIIDEHHAGMDVDVVEDFFDEDGELVAGVGILRLQAAVWVTAVADNLEDKYLQIVDQEPHRMPEYAVRMQGFRNVMRGAQEGREEAAKWGLVIGNTIYETAVRRGRSDMMLRIKRGKEAREQIIVENSGLVRKAVYSVCNNDEDRRADLQGHAHLEFLNCVDRTYDPNRGIEFSTYTYDCVRKKCVEEMQRMSSSPIRLPSSMMILKTQIDKGNAKLDGSDVQGTSEERARAVETRKIVHRASQAMMSIDEKRSDGGGDDGWVVADVLSDVVDPYAEVLDNMSLQQAIGKAVDSLSPVRRRVLELRGLLDDGEAETHSLEETAMLIYIENLTETAVTKERVRQIEAAALNEIRGFLERHPRRREDFVEGQER